MPGLEGSFFVFLLRFVFMLRAVESIAARRIWIIDSISLTCLLNKHLPATGCPSLLTSVMADSKDHGVAMQTSGYRRSSLKDIDEKQRASKGADLDLPSYSHDTERHGSEAVNLSGVHDNTHRKLKARHIQLIGFVQRRRVDCCGMEIRLIGL
jgi:hypothetical protein